MPASAASLPAIGVARCATLAPPAALIARLASTAASSARRSASAKHFSSLCDEAAVILPEVEDRVLDDWQGAPEIFLQLLGVLPTPRLLGDVLVPPVTGRRQELQRAPSPSGTPICPSSSILRTSGSRSRASFTRCRAPIRRTCPASASRFGEVPGLAVLPRPIMQHRDRIAASSSASAGLALMFFDQVHLHQLVVAEVVHHDRDRNWATIPFSMGSSRRPANGASPRSTPSQTRPAFPGAVWRSGSAARPWRRSTAPGRRCRWCRARWPCAD